MTTTRSDILTQLGQRTDFYRPMGLEKISDEHRFVSVHRDYMDWHPYHHLQGFATEAEALAFLNFVVRDDEGAIDFYEGDKIAVGVIDLDASDLKKAFRPVRMAPVLEEARDLGEIIG